METWEFILKKKSFGIRVVLLYVLESKGSSPGRQGFKMAVASDGEIFGTIGGGIMEHKFVELAKSQLLIKQDYTSEIVKQIHDKSASRNQSGMICSGEQTLFLYEIKKEELSDVISLINSLKSNKNGTLRLTPDRLAFIEQTPQENYFLDLKEELNDFIYEEKTGLKNILHIIGGGHCALAFSRLMSRMDFYIHLYDEREHLNTIAKNSFVHEKHILTSYKQLFNAVQSATNAYVVIMTFGYRTDDMALRALLGKSFKYIGLLGSKIKIEKMFEEYKKENLDDSLLKQIKAPIGIFIKSESVEEIAVSIAAEIISIKNRCQ